MNMPQIRQIFASLIAVAVIGLCSTASAQGPRPAHYYPARAPLSPYFGYSTINTTGLPSYYATVRPAQDLMALMRATRVASYRADSSRVTLNESLVADMVAQKIQMRQTTGIGSVSVPGTFQDYSHFYTKGTATAPPRARR